MLSIAYLSFLTADAVGLSSLMSVFFCGIMMSHYAKYNIRYVCMCVCMYVCMCVCVYLRVCVYKSVFLFFCGIMMSHYAKYNIRYVCMCVLCMYVCMYVFLYVCV